MILLSSLKIRKWKDIGVPLVVDVCKTYKEF
jgi:hypothetical protein